MNFLSARPRSFFAFSYFHLIAFHCFFHDLSSLSLLMNTTSSSPTFRTKNFEARRRKKSKDYYRSHIQHGKLRSTVHYFESWSISERLLCFFYSIIATKESSAQKSFKFLFNCGWWSFKLLSQLFFQRIFIWRHMVRFLRFLIVAMCREAFKVKNLNDFKQIQDQREMQATKTVVDHLVGVHAVSSFRTSSRSSASERDTRSVLREFD